IELLGYLFYIGNRSKTPFNYPHLINGKSDDWYNLRTTETLTPDGVVKQAKAIHSKYGFTSFKLKGGVLESNTEIETIKTLKKHFPASKISYDPNGCLLLKEAIVLGNELHDSISYMEDPCGSEDSFSGRETMATFRKSTNIKTATNMIACDWRELGITTCLNAVDIPLADPHFWTMSGSVEVSRFCSTHGMSWGSHSNNHFDISLAMVTHVTAAAIGEINPVDTHWIWQEGLERLTCEPLTIRSGKIQVPDAPGLGVKVDMVQLENANKLYKKLKINKRDDSKAMNYIIPNWKFNPKKAALVR
ncbi:glucarate dehydratase, partial [Verrucomicrobia bacterium]|nr:glucarate dehydratase [Verrucomicrobiota bacterium]